jgi:hypothetical protein
MAARPLLCILGPKPHLSLALRVRVHKLVELMALFWRLELDDLAWKDGASISGRGIFMNAFAMNARREKKNVFQRVENFACGLILELLQLSWSL